MEWDLEDQALKGPQENKRNIGQIRVKITSWRDTTVPKEKQAQSLQNYETSCPGIPAYPTSEPARYIAIRPHRPASPHWATPLP